MKNGPQPVALREPAGAGGQHHFSTGLFGNGATPFFGKTKGAAAGLATAASTLAAATGLATAASTLTAATGLATAASTLATASGYRNAG